jgi:hypothetical protein
MFPASFENAGITSDTPSINSYLLSALDNIEGAHDHVSKTARKDTTNHAFAVVAHIVNVTSTHFESFAE